MQRKGYVDYTNSVQVNELADAKRIQSNCSK